MSRLSPNTLAGVFMTLAMLAFAFNDAAMKAIGATIPLFQAVFLRGLLATCLVGALGAMTGGLRPVFAKGDLLAMSLRMIGELGGAVCYLSALFVLPLATVSATLQVMPLAVALTAAAVFGEPLGLRRLLAIGAGFLGMLLILRPGPEGIQPGMAWALGSVGFLILRDLATRRISRGVEPVFVTLATAVSTTLMGAVGCLFQPWVPVDGHHGGLLVFAAVVVLIGYFFGVKAMRMGDIAAAAPFRYTILIWSMLIGAIVFGEVPGPLALLGAAVVVGAGLYAFWRERALQRAAAAGETPVAAVPAPDEGVAGAAPAVATGAAPFPPRRRRLPRFGWKR